ncbi:MAG: BatD family protein [Bacteroidota bacterium]
MLKYARMVNGGWLRVCLLTGLLLLGSIAFAQTHGDNFQTVKLDRDRLALDDTLLYTIEVHNASVDEVFPPDFEGFNLIGNPFREENSSIIAGQSMLVTKINYRLVPTREGAITIQPGRIRLEGRLYYTNSRRVEVLPAGTTVDAVAPSNFLRLEIDRTRAFVGQQIIADLRLYTTVNRKGLNQLGRPSMDGFISKPRGNFDNRTQTVTENGKTYLAQTVESFALYPVRSGQLMIESFEYNMSVQSFRATAAGFRQPYTDFIRLISDSVSIEVSELPPPPTDFSGGIGEFRVSASVNRDTLSTDDALSLRLTILGDGDIYRVREIFPADPEDWEVYPPSIQVEEMTDSPTGYFGRKVIDYQLVPRKTGRLTLDPTLIVFKPDTAAYVDLVEENFVVQVGEGQGRPSYDTTLLDTTTTLTLVPSVANPRLYRPGSSPVRQPLYWILFALPLFIVGGFGVKRWMEIRADQLDPVERAQSKAARRAYKQLRKARNQSTDDQYAVVEQTLLQYLKDRFDKPLFELSKAKIAQLLFEENVDEVTAQQYVDLLSLCEQARYMPERSQADQRVVGQARDVIKQVEAIQSKKPVALQEDGQTI